MLSLVFHILEVVLCRSNCTKDP